MIKSPDLRNCLVTSYKAASKIMVEDIIQDIELEDRLQLGEITIIADKFCQDNYAYLFDEDGNLVATYVIEELDES